MSKCNFSISFFGPAAMVVEKARSAVENQGGSFNGDASAGTFEVSLLGSLSGSYNIAGQQMNIEIGSKPIFVSCHQIEKFLKDQLGK